MFYFTKPVGGLYMGKALVKPPFVEYVNIGAPVRIFFASDLHIRPNTLKTAENVISCIRSLSPDLVLFGGDFSEFDDGFLKFFELLKGVSVPMGMFSVEGNNDVTRFSGDKEKIKRVMQDAGVCLLRNECARISLNGKKIEIAGARNAYFETPDVKGLFSDDESAYRILLAHEPVKKTLADAQGRADLMLSGHTHGGQVNVMGFTCYELLGYERKFRYTHLAGMKKLSNTRVLVSRGIGTSKFAVRFGARPEVHMIT